MSYDFIGEKWDQCKLCGSHYIGSYPVCPQCVQKGYKLDAEEYARQVEEYLAAVKKKEKNLGVCNDSSKK